jgi:hypothetical protein
MARDMARVRSWSVVMVGNLEDQASSHSSTAFLAAGPSNRPKSPACSGERGHVRPAVLFLFYADQRFEMPRKSPRDIVGIPRSWCEKKRQG